MRRLLVVCVALIALDLALALRVRTLNRRVGSLTRLVEAGERPLLVAGEAFPELSLVGADAQPVALLDPASAGTLLLVSSLSCDVCDDVRPTWDATADLCSGSPLRILELVLDAKPSTLPAGDGRTPALASGGDAWAFVGRIPGVPAAILIDGTGTVRRAFYGAEHQGLPAAVEEFLFR